MTTSKNCVNCGKQNLVDDESKPTDKCFSCGKPIGIKEGSSEGPVAGQLHVDDLPEDTRSQVIAEAAKGLHPVSPRPDTTGMPLGKRNKALHAYYELNKESILNDLDLLGEGPMLKGWGIGWPTWYGLRHRWRPEKFPARKKREKKQKTTPTGSKRVKKTKKPLVTPREVPQTLEEAEEVCAGCPVVQAYKSYRLAVKDILGTLKKI